MVTLSVNSKYLLIICLGLSCMPNEDYTLHDLSERRSVPQRCALSTLHMCWIQFLTGSFWWILVSSKYAHYFVRYCSPDLQSYHKNVHFHGGCHRLALYRSQTSISEVCNLSYQEMSNGPWRAISSWIWVSILVTVMAKVIYRIKTHGRSHGQGLLYTWVFEYIVPSADSWLQDIK